MGQVYSQNLGNGVMTIEPIALVGPVPDGYRWVIRDIELLNPLTAPFPIDLSLGFTVGWWFEEGDIYVPWWGESSATAVSGSTQQWEGRQVVPDGAQLFINAAQLGWSYSVSGYALVLP